LIARNDQGKSLFLPMPPPVARAHAGISMAIDLQVLSNTLAETVAIHGRRGPGSSGIAWRDNLILTSSEGVRAEEDVRVGER
jgi:hypothetical protein